MESDLNEELSFTEQIKEATKKQEAKKARRNQEILSDLEASITVEMRIKNIMTDLREKLKNEDPIAITAEMKELGIVDEVMALLRKTATEKRLLSWFDRASGDEEPENFHAF